MNTSVSYWKRSLLRFTLIELLIVTAIIAILAGMLLPAQNKARESVKRTACSNNLRQLALMNSMYHSTFDSYHPKAYYSVGSEYWTWMWMLGEASALNWKILCCPNQYRTTELFRSRFSSGTVQEKMKGFWRCSYGINAGLGLASDLFISSFQRTERLKKPSQLIANAENFYADDFPGWTVGYSYPNQNQASGYYLSTARATGGNQGIVYPAHLNTTGVLWFDGHVTATDRRLIWAPAMGQTWLATSPYQLYWTR